MNPIWTSPPRSSAGRRAWLRLKRPRPDWKSVNAKAISELVNRKVKAGDTKSVILIESSGADKELSNVVDLNELLTNSLARRKAAPAKKPAPARARRG